MSRRVITAPDHDPNWGLGYLAADWITYFCTHGPGPVVDRLIDGTDEDPTVALGPEMTEVIVNLYAYSADGTRRLYNDALLSRAKGWAKSELAGWIVLFEAFGPCRVALDSFGRPRRARAGDTFRAGDFVYHYEPGDLMGEPVTTPVIRCLATEENQAGNTYNVVLSNLGFRGDGSRRLIETYAVDTNDVGVMKVKLPGLGEITPSTASAGSKDGGRETFVVFDETHLYKTPELHRLYDTVTRNLGKIAASNPWSLETTTMFAPGEGSVAEQTFKHAEMIDEGRSMVTTTYFDHRQAPDKVNLKDRDELRAAIIESFGDAAVYTDIDRKMADFFDARKKIEDSRRYIFNQPTAPSNAWISASEWSKGGPSDPDELPEFLEPGDQITLGFDGSMKRTRGMADATALIACRIRDGLIVPLLVDEQPEGPAGDDWTVDVQAFIDAVDDAFATYEVVGFYADPPLWEPTIAAWDSQYGDRLAVKATSKSATGWWTNAERRMGEALDSFRNSLLDGDLRHNGDPTLTRHILNARARPKGQYMRIFKENTSSRNKIDAAVAATMAYRARLDFIAAGGLQAKKKRPTRILVAR